MGQGSVSITGVAADLRWGYHVAATVRAWSVSGAAGAFTFTATIVGKDDFRISQHPLEVRTPNGWRWAVVPGSLQIAGTTLTASIRPLETPHELVAELPDRHA